MKIFAVFAVLFLSTAPVHCQTSSQEKSKTISVSLAVESEGPKGEWMQSAHDLTKGQLQKLETLIKAELTKQPLLVIVEPSDPKTHLHVSVVAGEVEHERKLNWVIVSSVITLATDKEHGNNDVLATHDVIAGPDLPSVARTVGYQVASTILRFMTGILK